MDLHHARPLPVEVHPRRRLLDRLAMLHHQHRHLMGQAESEGTGELLLQHGFELLLVEAAGPPLETLRRGAQAGRYFIEVPIDEDRSLALPLREEDESEGPPPRSPCCSSADRTRRRCRFCKVHWPGSFPNGTHQSPQPHQCDLLAVPSWWNRQRWAHGASIPQSPVL